LHHLSATAELLVARDDGTTAELCSRVDRKQLYLDLVTFAPETVCSTLKKLKPTTSLRPDNIPNVLLKKCANALSVPLAHIFDTSFKDNTLLFVGKLPMSVVQPVFKKDALTTLVIIDLYL